ncbi:hypothetical protein P7C70_g7067, partial [Phenoliferia sp. Uapishka_3]
MGRTETTLDLGYVSLASPEHGLKELGTEKLSDILIPGPLDHILIHIQYCLGNPTKFKLRPDSHSLGLTREEIIRGVVFMYTHVFKVEEETMPEKSAWENSGRSANRGATSGKYRIHMHELGDLILHTAYYDPVTREMTLGIDS